MLLSFPILYIFSISAGVPPQLTYSIALVRFVIFFDMSSGSIFPVEAVISAQTTSPPRFIIGVFVATQVMAVVITSVSGPTPQIFNAIVKALVQELTKIKFCTPKYFFSSLRNSFTVSPSFIKPESKTFSILSKASSFLICTLNNG